MRRKISDSVDGGPSGGSRVRRPGSEDPHRRKRKFVTHICQYLADNDIKVANTDMADTGYGIQFADTER